MDSGDRLVVSIGIEQYIVSDVPCCIDGDQWMSLLERSFGGREAVSFVLRRSSYNKGQPYSKKFLHHGCWGDVVSVIERIFISSDFEE